MIGNCNLYDVLEKKKMKSTKDSFVNFSVNNLFYQISDLASNIYFCYV